MMMCFCYKSSGIVDSEEAQDNTCALSWDESQRDKVCLSTCASSIVTSCKQLFLVAHKLHSEFEEEG